MDKNLVSIIMPAYNAESYIKDSIESVVSQIYKNWELIVIDDGSADDTANVVKQYINKDARVKYFFQPNGKQGKARNLGINNSKGSYIAFLDADDKWTVNKLAVQMPIITSNENIDLVFSQGYNLTEGKIEDCNVQLKGLWNYDDVQNFIHHNQIPILSAIVKKKALIKVNCFNEGAAIQNAEDYHLWLKLLIAGYKFMSIPDRLFYYRIHNQQATFQNSNINVPCFNVYQDIYYWCADERVKKIIIDKLKWFIYDNEFQARCIDLFSFHLAKKKLKPISYAVKNLFYRATPINKRVVFKLISVFV